MQKIVIASRKSDLARIQAQHVAHLLGALYPDLKIELTYRESLGDKNQHDPLWKMPEKGVFTQDFREDLLNQKIDIVVHSWKDLPTQMSAETVIVGSPKRADQRDLLFFKKSILAKGEKSKISLLSSSPRRSYNLSKHLKALLPQTLNAQSIEFLDVRGNVPTRIKKCLSDTNADGLVLAKAGVDRLLAAHHSEFESTNQQLRLALEDFRWMVLPLSLNPSAAAQGALAIEILSNRPDLRALIEPIICAKTTSHVQMEREILKSYGGGCHQKIGVSIIDHTYGPVLSLKGFTDAKETLDVYEPLADYVSQHADRLSSGFKSQVSQSLEPKKTNLSWHSDAALDSALQDIVCKKLWFPKSKQEVPKFFKRCSIAADYEKLRMSPLLVSRANALPDDFVPGADQVLWTSGLETWATLAGRGCWVGGSYDSLGESFESAGPQLHCLSPSNHDRFLKLTHSRSQLYPKTFFGVVPTYTLDPVSDQEKEIIIKELAAKKWFFWMSGSGFLEALSLCPTIKEAFHSCGPGNTLKVLEANIPAEKIKVFMSYSAWLKKMHQTNLKINQLTDLEVSE